MIAYNIGKGLVPLCYNGYLRSNGDNIFQNNLDKLSGYTYDKSNPLFRNIYDGTFFQYHPHLHPSGRFERDLIPRRWKLPDYSDRATEVS